jgi:outer membrane protein assembly factor BamB
MNEPVRVRSIVVGLFTCALLFSCASTQPTWWKYQGNLYNWGQAQSKGSMGNALHVRLSGNYCGCPVFWPKGKDSRVVMSFNNGSVGLIIPLQGMVARQEDGIEATSNCPAVPLNSERNPTIYVGTTSCHLIAFNEDLSVVKWDQELEKGATRYLGSPTVYENVVYITSDQTLYVRDAATGNALWEHKGTNMLVSDSPPIAIENDGAFIYVASTSGEITKYKASSVKQHVWTQPSRGYSITGHVMVDSHFRVYVPGNDGKMHVLDPATGRELWFLYAGSTQKLTGASLSFDGNTIYFADEKQFHAFSRTTQERLWYKDLTAQASTPPIVAPGATIKSNETIYLGIGYSVANSRVLAFNKEGDLWPAIDKLRGVPNAMAVDQEGTLYAVAGNELIIIK